MSAPRFEVVRSDAGWFARFVAANGRKVWQTEVYGRQRDARAAVALIGDAPSYSNGRDDELIEVREVDERTGEPPNLDDAEALGRWAMRQPAIRAHALGGRKIHAIAALRNATGAGLIQAKNAIEAGS